MDFVLPHECEYARGHWGDQNYVVTENVPGDAGGLTKFGLDQRSHPGVDIADLTRDQALAIYYDEDWKWRGIGLLPEKIAIALVDVRINGGFPIRWLQIALNKISNLDPPLTIDGDLGPKTLSAVQACNQSAVITYFLRERDARFESIATGPRAKFLAGWEQRDRDLEKFLAAA
jgi:lysozyme family protein